MKKFTLFLLMIPFCSFAQDKTSATFNKEEIVIDPLLKGSLYTPAKTKQNDLVILIAGSGPTDRDGNQAGTLNNSLKFLAEALAQNNISVFSYDKRVIAMMKSGNINEKELSFENFIDDAKKVISHFRDEKKYRHIIIAGHSEGSLIGMVAANGNADGYISIAGAGRSIDLILEDQLEKQPAAIRDEVKKDLDILKGGNTFELKNPMLASLFRESVQPYMISWIKYNPQDEIKKLKIPVLIINGTKDMQVKESEAVLLNKAKPDSQLVIIENMNHLFKDIAGDDAENTASYSNPYLPIDKKLVTEMVQFIKSI